MLQKIEDVSNLEIGKAYLVPCIYEMIAVKYEDVSMDWHDWENFPSKVFLRIYTPIYNFLHSDHENGQEYKHYHVDSRFSIYSFFTDCDGNVFPYKLVPKESLIDGYRVNLHHSENVEIVYRELVLKNIYEEAFTPVHLIRKSKLKHRCIHKNKCPHRGFDLSNAPDKDGVITCPLHGLTFDSKTKEIVGLELFPDDFFPSK